MIDPNEAPDGFIAAEEIQGCKGCAFLSDRKDCSNIHARCFSYERDDQENVIFIPREQSNLAKPSNIVNFAEAKAEIKKSPKSNLAEFSNIGEQAEAKAEIERWKSSHDHVCRELAACENARDENARLCEVAREESARWKAECRDRDGLIAKLKAQLTTALEAIARMR